MTVEIIVKCENCGKEVEVKNVCMICNECANKSRQRMEELKKKVDSIKKMVEGIRKKVEEIEGMKEAIKIMLEEMKEMNESMSVARKACLHGYLEALEWVLGEREELSIVEKR